MGSIWALADLHLPFGNPEKSMEIFGPAWKDYTHKIATEWKARVKPEDLVLLPGDLSWARDLSAAQKDLLWIDQLPGTKLICRGNHDYWWTSPSKLASALPPSLHFIHNNAFMWMDVAIGGTRLWDSEYFDNNDIIDFQVNPSTGAISPPETDLESLRKIYARELHRLRLSLEQMRQDAHLKIAMTHYPPLGHDLKPTPATKLLEAYKIDICVFGHLHNLKKNIPLFGTLNGIRYLCVAGDYLDFIPVKIAPIE